MIFGDPFRFAIQIDVVSEWNAPNDIWKNGLFCLYLNGKRLFDAVDAFELKTTMGSYKNADIDKLPINDKNLDSTYLYRNAEEYLSGKQDFPFEGLFDMTCTAMSDNQCYLYFIKTVTGDRFLWSLDNGKSISEVTLPAGTVSDVIKKLNGLSL
jgi:hypothetical protein